MTVTILGAGAPVAVQAEPGQTLLDILRAAHAAPDAPCGGNGTCGRCRVRVSGAVSAPEDAEQAAVRDGERLACRCRAVGECTVTLGRAGADVICTDGAGRAFPVTKRPGLGAAADIGTTTVVVYLYDLETGARLAHASAPSAQKMYGADVISRVSFCDSRPDGLELLAAAVREQLCALLDETLKKAGRGAGELASTCIAGNTVMLHILCGLDPHSIAVAPFTPKSLFGRTVPGGTIGLPDVPVLLCPCVAGYVGGDITAGLLASGAAADAGPCLFLDVGTNGEMALCRGGRIVTCATAAGPAFEGAEISCGIPARAGAIDRVWLADGRVQLSVLGGGAAAGVCGSGLLDALAVMLELGAVDETGRLLPPDETTAAARAHVSVSDGGVEFSLAPGVSVSAADVRALQLAKAAVAAGIETLLGQMGVAAEELTALYLAGGFGNYLRPESAARIGLFPACLVPRVVPCGNSAGAGAAAALCSDDARRALSAIAQRAEYLELSGRADFSEAYIDAMELPEA